MDYSKLAKEILRLVGGKENVRNLTHCVTRLRFNLIDESKAKTEDIKNLNGVLSVVKNMGQYQVVIGNDVADVYKNIIPLLGSRENSKMEKAKNQNIFNTIVNALSKMFQPILGVLAGAGMLKGVAALLLAFGFSNTNWLYVFLQISGDGLFQFLPILLAYTAAKYFDSNIFIAMAIAASMLYPSLSGKENIFNGVSFLGFNIALPNGGYLSTVMPIIFVIWLSKYIEDFLSKIIPSVVKIFLVPFFTILLSFGTAILLIGPFVNSASYYLGIVIENLFTFSGTLTGALLGGFWMVLVMFGMHWSIIPLAFSNFSSIGQDKLLAVIIGHSFALSGALLAIYFKTKEEKVKQLAIPSIISGIFGVTEPGIYGIALPMKTPFLIACIVSAIAGAIGGFFKLTIYILGGLGIFGLPSYVSPDNTIGTNFYVAIFLMLISFLLAFILMMFLKVPKIFESNSDLNKKENNKIEGKIYSPLEGNQIKLENVMDKAFASKNLGDGIAIIPKKGELYAPFDGTLDMVFETKHAVSLTSDNGVELLIHIGMDTVKLEGKYFYPKLNQGDKFKKGDLILTFDIDKIKEEGYSLETPVLITNTENLKDLVIIDNNEVDLEKEILIVIK